MTAELGAQEDVASMRDTSALSGCDGQRIPKGKGISLV